MATPSPDPARSSWTDLAAAARAQRPPAIDVRVAVRAALAAESRVVVVPGWPEALSELVRLPWMRPALACGFAAALLLCTFGWQAFARELSDPFVLAGGDEFFLAEAP